MGAYYFHDDLSSNSSFDLLRSLRDPTAPLDGFDPANSIGLLRYPFRQTTQSGAVFLQGDYRVAPRLKLTAGVRYTADSIDFHSDSFFDEQGFIVPVVSADESKAFGNVSYRVAADYDLAKDLHAYASISTGYNSGGYSGGAATDPAQLQPYRAESLTAYETGLKAELFGRRLRINTAAFFYDYSDLQVFIFDTTGPVPVQRKTNAGSATLYGAETEITARPTPDLTLFLSASALHSEYQDFADGQGDYAGHDLIDAPRLSGSLGFSYSRDLGRIGRLKVDATQTYQSRLYLTPANAKAYSQNAYGLLNARIALALPGDRWTLAVWGKNLTSQKYIIDISPIITLDQLNYGDPATYGVEARYRF